jgi:MFS transporter, PPP family, 3-phenylpropionic acid transporter
VRRPLLLERAGIVTSAYYAAFFFAVGAHVPFWPLWLADWGLGPGEVGLYTALGSASRVVGGLALPALADRLDARRMTIAVTAIAGAVMFLAHLGVESRALLLLLTLATGAALAGIGPIGEALGIAAARVHGFAYAQARAVGSAGFLAASLAIGATLPLVDIDFVLWWIVLSFVAVAWIIRDHPGGRKVEGQIPPNLREIRALLTRPTFAVFVLAIALLQASHATYYAYGSVHWRVLGVSEAAIGGLWAVGVAAEIVLLMTVGTAIVARIGPVQALMVCGVAGVVRWSAMMLDPTGPILVPLQAFHALTFAIGHLAAMAFIARAVPGRFGASAQGALSAVAGGMALSLGMAIAAGIYPHVGGSTYGIGATFSAAGLAASLWLGRRWRGETLAV